MLTDQTLSTALDIQRLSPGDIVAIATPNGVRHVQVTHLRAPYPDVLRAIEPVPAAETPEQIAKGKTAFIAMVELASAFRDTAVSTRVVGHATIPQDCRACVWERHAGPAGPVFQGGRVARGDWPDR